MQARRITGCVIGTVLSIVCATPAYAESIEEMRTRIRKEMQEMRRNTDVAEQKQRQEREQWEAKARLPDIASSAPIDSPVAGTGVATWTSVTARRGCIDLRFFADGTLQYLYDGGQSKGTWKQDGNTVYMLCDKKNCIERGNINGQRMEGETQNRSGDVYTWVAELNPESGNCHSRIHLVPLRQRASLTRDQINRAKQTGWATTARTAEYDDAKAAVSRGEDVVGFRKMIAVAEAGDARAQYFMGDMYARTQRVSGYYEPNVAVKWYRMAAAQGHPDAENELGTMYHEGTGVTRDYGLAMKWYLYADADGNTNAPYNLGLLYEYGLGVAKDLNQSLGWYRKAEARGHVHATDKLDILDIANKAKRYAAKTQPSNTDVTRLLVSALARFTDRGEPDYPDRLTRTLPIVGEVRKVQISIRDLQCGSGNASKGVPCSFIATQTDINGFIAAVIGKFAWDKQYSAKFIKGANDWYSPQLDDQVKVMGAAERAAGAAMSPAGSAGGESGYEGGGGPNAMDEWARKESARTAQEQAWAERKQMCPRQSVYMYCNGN